MELRLNVPRFFNCSDVRYSFFFSICYQHTIISSDRAQIRSIAQCVTHSRSCRPNNTGRTKTSDRSQSRNVSETQRDFNFTLSPSPFLNLSYRYTSRSPSLLLSVPPTLYRSRRHLPACATCSNYSADCQKCWLVL